MRSGTVSEHHVDLKHNVQTSNTVSYDSHHAGSLHKSLYASPSGRRPGVRGLPQNPFARILVRFPYRAGAYGNVLMLPLAVAHEAKGIRGEGHTRLS